MKVIALHGPGNVGKTTAIKLALRMWLTNYSPIRIRIDLPAAKRNDDATIEDVAAIPPNRAGCTNADKPTDIVILLEMDKFAIVFGSEGDTVDVLNKLKNKATRWIAELGKATFILICATKETTKDVVASWAQQGDDLEWIEKPLDKKKRYSEINMNSDNSATATGILARIKRYLTLRKIT